MACSRVVVSSTTKHRSTVAPCALVDRSGVAVGEVSGCYVVERDRETAAVVRDHFELTCRGSIQSKAVEDAEAVVVVEG